MTPGIEPSSEVFDTGLSRPPNAEDIRAQIQRIIRSEGFTRSERLKRFLGFTVEETLAGRGHQIKAYTIAVGVCDRDQRFDSRLDPIVRIEAGRLRRALQHHYLTVGRADPVLIDIPKGGYHPVFSWREIVPVAPPITVPAPAEHRISHWRARASALRARLRNALHGWDRGSVLRAATFATAIAVLAGAWSLFDDSRIASQIAAAGGPAVPRPAEKMALVKGPAIILLPFESLSAKPEQDRFAQGLTDDLTRYLSMLADLSVYPVSVAFPLDPQSDVRGGRQGAGEFVIRGSVRRTFEKVRISAQLIDARTGAGLWAQTFDRVVNLENAVEVQDEIARSLVTKLVGSNGVITDAMLATFLSGADPRGLGTYECTLRQYRFMRSWVESDHQALRLCFERAVADHPDFARGWSSLAYVYLNEYRYGYGNDGGNAVTLERALIAARRAVELDRMDVPSREALSIALYYGRDFARSFAVSEALAAQFPTDPELAARIAARFAFAGVGHWDDGMERFYAARARTPDPPGWYALITALDAYRQGDDREALREANKIEMAGFIMRPMIYAMIYGQLGMQAKANVYVAEARRLNPAFVENPQKWFQRLTFDPVLFARMMEGLEKAGLNVHGGADEPAGEN
jgi:TolB-like protein